MAQKRFGQFDQTTGEVTGGFVAYVAPRRLNGFGEEGWVAMAQQRALLLAQSDLRGDDLRVLLALIGLLDYENLIQVSQAEIGRLLKMRRQNVQRSIRSLLAHGAVLEGPKVGVSRSYQLNPRYGWKGSAKNHVTALDGERSRRLEASRISGVIEGGVGTGEPPAPERDPDTADLFDEPA